MANKFAEKMKKRAAENPAMMFISEADPEEVEAPKAERLNSTRTIPEQERIHEEPLSKGPRAPQGVEAKTRRLQLLLRPSLYEAVKARAEEEGLSVNEEISKLLIKALY